MKAETPIAPEHFAPLLAGEKARIIPAAKARRILGKSASYVQALIDSGELEAMAPRDRKKRRYSITVRSILKHIAETADYDPTAWEAWADKFVASLSSPQVARLLDAARRHRLV